MHPFRAAVEARDFTPVPQLLAPEVTFFSPVAFRPYEGRELCVAILRGVDRVFGPLVYTRELSDDDGRGLALMFETTIGEVAVNGCDFLRFDDAGLISELKVMVRPLSAAQALAAAMSAQFERIQAEATAALSG